MPPIASLKKSVNSSPYGGLATRCRYSSFTTLRSVTNVCSSTWNDAIRSASSHNAISRALLGTVLTYTVWSKLVNALLLPPTLLTRRMCSSLGTFWLPRNIMCSNMWAKPRRSLCSSLEPTW